MKPHRNNAGKAFTNKNIYAIMIYGEY